MIGPTSHFCILAINLGIQVHLQREILEYTMFLQHLSKMRSWSFGRQTILGNTARYFSSSDMHGTTILLVRKDDQVVRMIDSEC